MAYQSGGGGYRPPSGGYGPPGGGYGPQYGGGYPMEHPQGTTILVLGILSLVLCGLLAPVAWIMGNDALRDIDQNPMAYSNRGTVNAGRICGIVGTVLLAFGVVWLIFVFGVLASA